MSNKTKVNKIIKNKNYHGYLGNLKCNDKRIPKFVKQYKKYGFDDTETWALDVVIAKFVLPRLKRLKKITIAYPCEVSFDEWLNIIDKMVILHMIKKL